MPRNISREAAVLKAEIDGELGTGYPRPVRLLSRPLKERIFAHIKARRSFPTFSPMSYVCTDLGLDARTLRWVWKSWAPTQEGKSCAGGSAEKPSGISVFLPQARIEGLSLDDTLAVVDRLLAHSKQAASLVVSAP